MALWVLALAPVAIVPGGLFRFELPKLLVAVVGVGIAAWAAPGVGRLPREVTGLIALGSILLMVAALSSAAPLAQVLGRWPRYEGLVALPAYLGALWAGARLLGPSAPPGRLRTLESELAVAAIPLGLISVLEAFGLRPLGGDAARPGSLLGNATEQGIVGMVLLCALVLRALRNRRPLVIVGAIAAAAALVLSGSRAALLGSVVALVLVAVATAIRAQVSKMSKSWRVAARLPAMAACLVAAAAIAVPATRDRVLGQGWAGATVDGRLRLWSDSWRLLRTRPWTGVGPSGFVDAIAGGHSEAWALRVGSADPPDSPHSWPLQALAAGGIPLLAVCIALVAVVLVLAARTCGAAFRSSVPTSRTPDAAARADAVTGWLAAVVGYGVALLTHFTSPGTTPLVAFLVGALVSRPLASPAAQRGPKSVASAAAQRGQRTNWAGTSAATPPTRSIFPAVVAALCGVGAVALGLGVAAEVVLASAVSAAARADTAASESGFSIAAHLRPWDGDVPLIAALGYLPGTIAGDAASAKCAAGWSWCALEATPDSVEAGRVRALALGTLGDVAGGRRIIDGLVERAPSDSDVQLAAGVLAGQSNDADAALAHFLVAAKYNPDDLVVWQDLVVVYRFLGRTADANAAQAMVERLTVSSGG